MALLKRLARSRSLKTPFHLLAFILLALSIGAPVLHAWPISAPSVIKKSRFLSAGSGKGKALNCGYDPCGAEDEWSYHKLNLLRLRAKTENAVADAKRGQTSSPTAQDVGDTALIEDDGTIIMPPNKFNLKNQSVLF